MRTRAILATALGLLASLSLAQPRNMSETISGTGRLSMQGARDATLERAMCDIRSNGDWRITVWSGSASYSFSGRYTGSGDAIRLDVRDGFGSFGAVGDGTLRYRGMNVDSFEFSGETRSNANRDRFSVRFSRTDFGSGGGPGGPGWDNNWGSGWIGGSFSDYQNGSGDLRINGRTEKSFNAVKVNLKSGGRAEIRFEGGGGAPFYGTWSGNGNNKSIRIEDGIGDRNTTGTGTIEISGSDVRRIALSGRRGRDRWVADFRSSGRPNRPGGGWGNGSVRPQNEIVPGRGFVAYNGRRNDFDRVYVNLKSDMSFEIRFAGSGGGLIRGVWTSDRSNVAQLTVNDAFGRRASGNGTVRFNGRDQISGLDVSGDARDGRFIVNFDRR